MLAFAWRWDDSSRDGQDKLSDRLAASLSAGIGGQAVSLHIGKLHFAYRSPASNGAARRAWRPAALPSGRIAAFHGYFDNAGDIAEELRAGTRDSAHLYGLAVERWGDEAGRRIIGEYCAVIVDPVRRHLHLSRSPLRAPPLFYYYDEHQVAVASVPRALFAAGVEQRLNETHLADSAVINFTDPEAGWFEEVAKVPIGHIVEVQRNQRRGLRKYYDLFAAPEVRLPSDADYIGRVGELLDEGVRTCLSGFRKPGAALSSGLDSPQVAVRALNALPASQRLPTFTFHPEPGFDGRIQPGKNPNERPMVEAFAAMHPRLDPHFTSNEGYGHDHRWNEFFHLMGGAPSGLCNMYVFHGLFAGAAREGCDVLLLAEWGNWTFSDKGDWGFVEYLLTGKWRQLWLGLKHLRHDDRPIPVRFALRSLSAFLPTPLWRLGKRFGRLKGRSPLDLMQPLTPEFRVASGAQQRLEASGICLERYQPWNRREAVRHVFQNHDAESAEVYQAFEQMYGVAQRDPTAYRPLVEFCLGLPTELFMRDGTMRWLAKELARGIMPEEQRDNRLNGRWDPDWHLRIGRRRREYLEELDRLERDPRMAAIVDIPRLRQALEDWPEQTETDYLKMYTPEFAVPRGLLTARFIRYVEGTNV